MPLQHLFLMVVICLAWSFNFTAGAAGMQHFPPLLFMVLRFGLILLLVFPLLRRPPAGQWPRLITVCLLIGAFHFSLMFWALARSQDVSSVAIVQQTYIPIAVVLAIALLGEQIGWRSMTATLVAFAGVLVIGFDPLVLGQLDVLALALLSALFQALGSIYMRGIRGVGALNFQAWSAIISLPFLIVASFIVEQDQLITMQTANAIQWASVVYSALIASLVGHGLFYFLVQRHPISTLMPYMLLTPVFAVIFGILVWGDQPGWRIFVGGLMVLFGIAVITMRARRKFVSPFNPRIDVRHV
jgi:O-acetylserine/cysteine efflux transporter